MSKDPCFSEEELLSLEPPFPCAGCLSFLPELAATWESWAPDLGLPQGAPGTQQAEDPPHAVFRQVLQGPPKGVHVFVHTQVPVCVMGRVKVGHDSCGNPQAPKD